MWFLNKKTIILDLPKLSYKCGEEVNWKIRFDFWTEKVKADKIIIGLNRNIISNWIKIWEWVSVKTNRKYNYILETNLLWKWEYTKEEIPFRFIIPNNAVPDNVSFDKLLNKIPKAFRSIIEILIDMFMPNMRKRYSFEIIARIDIPWAIDITETVAINISWDLATNTTATNNTNNETKDTQLNTHNTDTNNDFIIK